MNARQVIVDVAGRFDTTAQAILARCEQTGVILRMEGEQLKAKGNRETITAWQPMIQRHKPEITTTLCGQPTTTEADDTLLADYEELTSCIIELCQLAGYADDVRERMLAARRNLYPFQIATECVYFRWQVIRARAGAYWHCNVVQAGI